MVHMFIASFTAWLSLLICLLGVLSIVESAILPLLFNSLFFPPVLPVCFLYFYTVVWYICNLNFHLFMIDSPFNSIKCHLLSLVTLFKSILSDICGSNTAPFLLPFTWYILYVQIICIFKFKACILFYHI